ncbi:hypothetical protein [Marinobacter sp. SS13-12]|uniref:hypothetical protein n=1 Tax=Marinobacter sp. SS13-12 TaxID=3050451 RepID=UPI00255610CF|nr:hypothetical protein [Marinobacter sp. SS13-12]MDK8465238.1 hypothetical protein [Marinobacter sp. SS13-12]
MKRILIVLFGLGLAGCVSQQPAVNLNNPDSAIVGEKPEGYPRTYIKQLPDLPGFCIEVTEDWRENLHQGETIWRKEKTIKSVNCPGKSWWQQR